jgi:hypothetical protein
MSPSIPTPKPPPKQPRTPDLYGAREDQKGRTRSLLTGGVASNILTGPRGLQGQAPQGQAKTLLGQ